MRTCSGSPTATASIKFPGAWLYSSGHPVLHLNDISQTDKQQRVNSGVSIM